MHEQTLSIKERLDIAKIQVDKAFMYNDVLLAKKNLNKFYNLYLDCQNTSYVHYAEYLKLKLMIIIIAKNAGIKDLL